MNKQAKGNMPEIEAHKNATFYLQFFPYTCTCIFLRASSGPSIYQICGRISTAVPHLKSIFFPPFGGKNSPIKKKYIFTVLQLGFKKGRVAFFAKRALSTHRILSKGHFRVRGLFWNASTCILIYMLLIIVRIYYSHYYFTI